MDLVHTVTGLIDLNATLPAQILNFVVLVILLRAFAYKPLVKVIEERQQRIASTVAKADADAEEAAKTLSEYKAQLAEARAKAQEIVELAEKRAADEHSEAIKATRLEIEQMKKDATAEIERERIHAVEVLRGEMVTLSLAAAGKIIERNLENADNEAIIGDFIARLDAEKIGDVSC